MMHVSCPPVVIVMAIGALRSPLARVNDFDDVPLFATVPLIRWYAGNGACPEEPSACATAAYASSRPAPQSLSLPAGPASTAVPSIALRTSAWVHVGLACFKSAATPATYGVENDVPSTTS